MKKAERFKTEEGFLVTRDQQSRGFNVIIEDFHNEKHNYVSFFVNKDTAEKKIDEMFLIHKNRLIDMRLNYKPVTDVDFRSPSTQNYYDPSRDDIR
jgi:hypothetical protein